MKTVYYAEIDSTNEEARRRFAAGEAEPLLLWANMQTAGKGRNGRSFYSPENTGLYFSLLYPCNNKTVLQDSIFVTTVAAVAVCEALREPAGVDAGIKWVNDVYVGGRKVCGILAEAAFREDALGIIVGIGINLSTHDFPKEIENLAGGVGDYSEDRLAAMKEAILEHVGDELCEFFQTTEENRAAEPAEAAGGASGLSDREAFRKRILASYKEMSIVLGKEVSFCKQGEESEHGIAKEILDDGSLVVACADGDHILNSGEIHLAIET